MGQRHWVQAARTCTWLLVLMTGSDHPQRCTAYGTTKVTFGQAHPLQVGCRIHTLSSFQWPPATNTCITVATPDCRPFGCAAAGRPAVHMAPMQGGRRQSSCKDSPGAHLSMGTDSAAGSTQPKARASFLLGSDF